MKLLLTVLTTLSTLASFSQTGGNGKPVFNSIEMGEDSLNGCRLLANYYTLRNNIDNKTTSVYISDKPTTEEVATAATRLPADFFILMKGDKVIKMILVNYYPKKNFLVVTPGAPGSTSYPNTLKGDIAENRANELLKAGFDSLVAISDGRLTFNNKHYTVTPDAATRQAVISLIMSEHFDAANSTGMTIPSKDQLHTIILNETKEGGKLDFFSSIKGKEMEGIQIKPGVFATRIGLALYKWGKANYDLGVPTIDEAYAIFAEFRGRPLDLREKAYIKLGFEKGLEK
jgi:hypothetical protein